MLEQESPLSSTLRLLSNTHEHEHEQEDSLMPMSSPPRKPTTRVELKTNGRKLFIATNLGTHFWRGFMIFIVSFLGLNQFNLLPFIGHISPHTLPPISSPPAPNTSTTLPNNSNSNSSNSNNANAGMITEDDCVEKVIQALIDRNLLPNPKTSSSRRATPSRDRNIFIPQDSRLKLPKEPLR